MLDLERWEARFLTCSFDDGIAWVRLNRPPVNALHSGMLEELVTAFESAVLDPRVRVVALGSAVPGFFSAGLDLKEFAQDPEGKLAYFDPLFKDKLFKLMWKARKPFVCVIDGHVMGGGLELALACDLRVAARSDIQFKFPEVTLGGMPGGGGLQLLIRVAGAARAMRLGLLGEAFDVQHALDWGIIDASFNPETDGQTFVASYLKRLATGPTEAQAAIKLAVRFGAELPVDQAMLWERELYQALARGGELSEGIQAFLEKRAPRFVGDVR